jgi:membrane protein
LASREAYRHDGEALLRPEFSSALDPAERTASLAVASDRAVRVHALGMTRARSRSTGRFVHEQVDLWVDLFQRHNLLTFATAIAMQALVAFVSLTLLVVGVLGMTGHEEVWDAHLGPAIAARVLPDVYAGANATVQKILSGDGAGLVAFAALLTIWEVSGAIRACMSAFSRIEEAPDDRPWWVRFPLAIAIAVGLTACLLGAYLLVAVVGHLAGGGWRLPFTLARWLVALGLIAFGFGVVVRFAPRERRPTKWASAGASFVVVCWVVQSLLFRWYVTSLANFRSPSGSLGGVFVLTTYLYVAGIVLLVGIELDELLRADLASDESGPGIVDFLHALATRASVPSTRS